MPLHRLGGVELNVERQGHGTTVVYVHGGFACLGRTLQGTALVPGPWQADFADHFCLLSYDRRGFGRSSAPADGYDLPTQAGDLAALLDRFDLDRVHLLASSAGAPIAVRYAGSQAGRVASLTIQGSSLVILRPGDGVRDEALAAYRHLGRDGAAAAFTARPAGVEIWFESPWGRRQAEADGRLPEYLAEEGALLARAERQPTSTRIAQYAIEVRNIHAYEDLDQRPHAAAVGVPTLVLHGERDRIFAPAAGAELADAIPGGRFALIEDAGHGPIFTSPAARREAIHFMQASEHDRRAGAGAVSPERGKR
jgi:pimeloyl-ACP methyl ester carboxylesterase